VLNHKHYVPVLKGKAGDFWAIQNLKQDTRGRVTPLIEVVPPSAKMSEEDRLDGTARCISTHWPDEPCFVDLIWRDNSPMLHHEHVVDFFFRRARSRALHAVPVTALARSPAYQQAVARVVEQDGKGMAIRLGVSFVDDLATAGRLLDALLGVTKTNHEHVDMIIEAGSVTATPAAMLRTTWREAIDVLPHLERWRSVTVLAGSFPASLAGLPQATWSTIRRREWDAWSDLVGSQSLARKPTYADYVIGDPIVPFSGQAAIAANLRYSTPSDFLVWRGYAVNNHPLGFGQIHTICADLVRRDEFSGADFSRGDFEIQQRAANQDSPGNAQQWRQWATNHYIELVSSQVANLL